MPNTNFDIAPPVKTVDGLKAVPIDIQLINATLTFNGADSPDIGDATVEFTMGSEDGNPIFDLRQTITGAWLDGTPVPLAHLAHHDFGGGAGAELRILESVLSAGSTHTLRVTYDLGTPQASTAGSYQPQIAWSAGPRLVFNFGFTDLGPGRYLEAWIPANLIFDQFELTLEVILNTTVAHSVITNGDSTSLGQNHWSIKFPASFTAFSHLLEVRAGNTLVSLSDTVTLPVSGTTVTIEAWKLATGSANLSTQTNLIKSYLVDNENSVGPYLHGNRLVAFFNVGGMEYAGGTTTSTSVLRHEIFHSWWARGLKPASQPDAWWDEAWTKYNDYGASGSLPFNFTDLPVQLCSRNPWSRITPGNSYSSGRRFFEGVGSTIGVANMNSLMSAFYNERNSRPATTTDMEEFLVCRTGEPLLVDAFHRFVYGFNDPLPVPNLWIRDAPRHTGSESWGGRFWDSPDLWIRNKDDGGTTHQQPKYGQDNWFHARVRNRSATAVARHFLVTFNVKVYAGTEFRYPSDFLPCIAAASGFDLGPGESTVVKARWPAAMVPPAGTHACWLASVITRSDHPVDGRHVWEDNNLAQKNLTVAKLAAGDWMVLPFVIDNLDPRKRRRFRLELLRPLGNVRLNAALFHPSVSAFRKITGRYCRKGPPVKIKTRGMTSKVRLLDCGGSALKEPKLNSKVWSSRNTDTFIAKEFSEAARVSFSSGRRAAIPVSLNRQEQVLLGLWLQVPKKARPKDVITLDLVKRAWKGKRILGGFAIEIHVI
jgi:hypothetical protein